VDEIVLDNKSGIKYYTQIKMKIQTISIQAYYYYYIKGELCL